MSEDEVIEERVIIEVSLKHQYPHIILNSKVDFSESLPIIFEDHQKYELEGELGDYFNIYIQKAASTEAYQSFAPHLLVQLLELQAICDVEVVDNKLFCYWVDEGDGSEFYERIFAVASRLATEIEQPNERRMTSVLPVIVKAREAEKVRIKSARRLSLTKPWLRVSTFGFSVLAVIVFSYVAGADFTSSEDLKFMIFMLFIALITGGVFYSAIINTALYFKYSYRKKQQRTMKEKYALFLNRK